MQPSSNNPGTAPLLHAGMPGPRWPDIVQAGYDAAKAAGLGLPTPTGVGPTSFAEHAADNAAFTELVGALGTVAHAVTATDRPIDMDGVVTEDGLGDDPYAMPTEIDLPREFEPVAEIVIGNGLEETDPLDLGPVRPNATQADLDELNSKGKIFGITDSKGAKANISDLEIWGDGDAWLLISKASSQSAGWMKSTKAMPIDGSGVLVQTETQQRALDGSYAVSQAVVFIPNVNISEKYDPITDTTTDRKITARLSGLDPAGQIVVVPQTPFS